jgi:hypothetical protein
VGKEGWGFWVLQPLCVFGCISDVVEGACVRGLGVYTVGTVG